MSRLPASRRSVLAMLATSGLLTGSTSATETASKQLDPDTASAEISAQRVSSPKSLGVEFMHRDSGERWLFENPSSVDTDLLTEGEYDTIEVVEKDGTITQESGTYYVSDSVQTRVEDGREIRVQAATTSYFNNTVPIGGKVEVLAGVVEVENGRDVAGVPGIDLELRLVNRSNGEIVDSTQATTGDAGGIQTDFSVAGLESGRYDIVAESSDGDQQSDRFSIGRHTDFPFHWTGMTPGEETTLGVYSAQGREPESGVTRTIEVDSPEGTDTFDVEIGPGGIGLLQYTPVVAGPHRLESPTAFAGIGCGELKALNPYFSIRDQYVGDTVTWGTYILEDNTPVTGLEVEVTLRNDTDNTVVDQLTATTNDFGQFLIEFDAPDDSRTQYRVELTAADGRSIFLFGDRIFFEDPPQDTEPATDNLDVSINNFRVGVDTTVPIDVSLTESGDPVANTSVSLLFGYTFRQVPAGEAVIETDADGQASYEFTIPETAPDGERLYVMGAADFNSETYTDTASAVIRQYQFEYGDNDLERGTTNTIPVNVFDRATEEPIPDVDITMFGNRYNVNTETFDADSTTTDANGSGTIDLTIPDDVTRDIMINPVHRYNSTSRSGGSMEPPFRADVSVSPENPAPGDAITVSYTTNHSTAVSALVAFPPRENATVTILPEGTEQELTVPADISPGDFVNVDLLMLGSDGEAAEDRGFIQIAEELTASFEFSPTEPTVGEGITFTDTSSAGPDANITDREWDLTGDGITDTTGESVTFQYDEPGEYTVGLTVIDGAGNTDTVTQTVSVSASADIPPVDGDAPPQDLNNDGLYRDINGDGEFDIFDIQALYNNLDTDAVQNNPAAFNFANDDNPSEVTIFDVQALFNDLDQGTE